MLTYGSRGNKGIESKAELLTDIMSTNYSFPIIVHGGRRDLMTGHVLQLKKIDSRAAEQPRIFLGVLPLSQSAASLVCVNEAGFLSSRCLLPRSPPKTSRILWRIRCDLQQQVKYLNVPSLSVFFSTSSLLDRSCALPQQTLRRRSSSLQPAKCKKTFSVAAVPLVTSTENTLDPFIFTTSDASFCVFTDPEAEAMLCELNESQDGVNVFATDLLEGKVNSVYLRQRSKVEASAMTPAHSEELTFDNRGNEGMESKADLLIGIVPTNHEICTVGRGGGDAPNGRVSFSSPRAEPASSSSPSHFPLVQSAAGNIRNCGEQEKCCLSV
eukprot:gene9194-10848_t